MGATAAIAGASGYSGGELMRLLAGHPGIDLLWAAAHTAAGDAISKHARGMPAEAGAFAPLDAAQMPSVDVLFVALPAGEGMRFVEATAGKAARIVDLGPDYRLDASGYEKWYGAEHTAPDSLADWVYGLTEAERAAIAGATRVANPGCYPTATLLALLPLLKEGLLGSGPVVVDAKSGVSGAGRSLSQQLHFPEMFEDMAAYGVTGHRHQPEIESGIRRYSKKAGVAEAGPAGGGAVPDVVFTPHLVPLSRGLLVTCYLGLESGVSETDVKAAAERAFGGERFVTLTEDPPHAKAVRGSNVALVSYSVDEEKERAIAMGAIDNLVKGAAGQALQNANLMLGLDEEMGLAKTGLWP